MRIAFITSNLFKIPPEKGHAVQQVTGRLVEGLVAKGHEVTLFGPGNCQTAAKLVSIVKRSLDELLSDETRKRGVHLFFDTALAAKAFQQENAFDLYHVSLGSWENIVFLAQCISKPVVVTLHDPLNSAHLPHLLPELSKLTNVFFVSISDAQKKPIPTLNYRATVYHGINAADFPLDAHGGDYLFWLGRPTREKGLDVVLEVARRTGVKVKLAPLVWSWKSVEWEKEYEDLLAKNQIEVIDDVSGSDLVSLYQHARAFLFPIQWEEPFGLVMIEAMATGTPVIAFNRGSVPEVVRDGETGFIVKNQKSLRQNSGQANIKNQRYSIESEGLDGMIEAVERIYNMSEDEYRKMRENCRKHVEENFTVARMVEGYERVYRKILNIEHRTKNKETGET